MDRQGILIVSPSENVLSAVTTRLVGANGLATERRDEVDSGSWTYTSAIYKADNKYYTANIPIGWCSDLSQMRGDDMVSVWPALVFVVDPETRTFFEELIFWWESYDDRFNADIPLVVAFGLSTTDDRVLLDRVSNWCIDHGFELIEINEIDPCSENNDHHSRIDVVEDVNTNRETGIARLQDALQAYIWPHATMKENVHRGRLAHASSSHGSTQSDSDRDDNDNEFKSLLLYDDLEPDADQLLFEKVMAMSQGMWLQICFFLICRSYVSVVELFRRYVLNHTHCRVSFLGNDGCRKWQEKETHDGLLTVSIQ